MKRYIEFPVEGGGSLVVEVEEPASEYGTIAVGRPEKVAERATTTFGDALARIQPAISTVIRKLNELQPQELTIEFGIKMNAEAGAFLASAATEANFTVSIKWQPGRQPNP